MGQSGVPYFGAFCLDARTLTNEFSIKPLKVNFLAGGQKATEPRCDVLGGTGCPLKSHAYDVLWLFLLCGFLGVPRCPDFLLGAGCLWKSHRLPVVVSSFVGFSLKQICCYSFLGLLAPRL